MEEREGARGPSRNYSESPDRLPFPSPTRPAAAAAAAAPSSPPAAAPARRAVTLLLLYPSSSSPRCPCPLSSPLLPFPSAPLARTRARSSRTVSHSHARPPPAPARKGMRSRRTGPAARPPGARRGHGAAGAGEVDRGWRGGDCGFLPLTDTRSHTRGREPAAAARSGLWSAAAAAAARVALSALRTGHSVFRAPQAGLPAALHMVRSEGGGGGRGCGKRRRTRPERSGEFFFLF